MRALFAGILLGMALTCSVAQAEPPEPAESVPPLEVTEATAPSRWNVRGEYLLWWIKKDRAAAPLLTTGAAGDPNAGILGRPGTGVFFGRELDYRLNSGGRVFLDCWLDDSRTIAAEVGGFVLETHTVHGEQNSNRTDGAPVIARPFFNLLTGREDAQIITSPQDPLGGRYLGGIDIFGDSRTWGGEANLLLNLAETRSTRDLLSQWLLVGGFRYLGQKDQLRFSQSSTVLKPGTMGFGGVPAPAPDIVSLRDYFETNNHFYGGQLGARTLWQFERWQLALGCTVGLGVTEQNAEISAHTLLTDPSGQTLRIPGGLYAPASFVGHHLRHELSFISEAEVRLGYRLTRRCQASIGYSFLFWNDVARPADQLDRAVDPRLVPSNLAYNPAAAPAPSFQFDSTDFWAQGLTFGLGFRY